MTDPEFRLDREQPSIATPQLRELQLLKPQPSSQIQPWKKPKSSYPAASSEITHSSSLFAKKKLSGELSC
eukprot:c37339_g1_i1 orf=234-443(+)